jgi:antitoxin (DNA-binding transcriptional repressor) of toxin-antitoxin stability system
MKTARLSEVKDNLSRYVRYVRQGGRVRILVRDLPVAEIVPLSVDQSPDESEEARLRDLERRGILRRAPGETPAELLKVGPRARGRPLSAILIEQRRAGQR